MNIAVFALVAILCLLSVSSLAGLIHVVRADGRTIYINADGSISPSTAPIYTADNITYTLTGNITATPNGIVIERNNTVLNGAGYTVTGSENGDGISFGLANMGNVTVTNMMIRNFTIGIYLNSCSDFTLSGNTVTNNDYGVVLDSSSNCTLSGDNVTANNGNGIEFESSSDKNILSSNNVKANSGYGIYLGSSSNNNIYHNNFINNTQSQAYSLNSANVWDNGSSGNYWSDYLTKYPNATQVDSTGVWNTPYVIDTNNTDDYPLMASYPVIPEFPSSLALSLFMMATLLALVFLRRKNPIQTKTQKILTQKTRMNPSESNKKPTKPNRHARQ